MKNQRKRLFAILAAVLACIMVLPVFSGCGKGEEAPTTTAEDVFQDAENKVPATSKTPEVTKSNPNAESLQSTPNKGGNKKVTSGTSSVKSKYSEEQEALAKLDVNAARTAEERRNYAEAYMRAMLTVEWTLQERPATQVSLAGGEATYYLHDYANEAAWQKAFANKEIQAPSEYNYAVNSDGESYKFQLRTGRVYRGLPYSQGASGLDTFNLFVKEKNENGISVMDTRFDTYYLHGAPGLIGNAPDTALIYAWNTVSYSSRAQTAIHMVPTNGYYFVDGVKLPEYTKEEREAAANKPPIPDPNGKLVGAGVAGKLYHLIDDDSLSGDTAAIATFNGEQGMYAAYANAKKADGLVHASKKGSKDVLKAKMVVSVNVVKNPDGTIDGAASYMTVLAQTTEIQEVQGVYCFGEVDKKYTFKELFDGAYVPMTVRELNDGSYDNGQAMVRDQYEYTSRQTGAYIYDGIINGSRRIIWVNTVITDAEGKELFNNTAFAERSDILVSAATESGRYTFNLAKLDDGQEKITSLGSDVISNSALGKGTFHYKVTAHMISGEDVVVRDYTYTNK